MIELKNVTKKYGDFKALDDVSFKIEKGEIVGFLGQNGAGKTTTMKIITGLIEPTEGQVFINNEPIGKKNKTKIGFMPENTPLYDSLTVKEFISFMAEIKGLKRADRKKEAANLISKLNLQSVENKVIKNLSKGYKQRVSLAGVLVGNPEVLILDEPNVGLDPKQIIEVRNLITSLKGDHTILLSSHILTEINQICDRVIIIDNGKIIATDTTENLENRIEKNIINVVVEDPDNNIDKIKNSIKEITDIKFIGKNDDNDKEYQIEADSGVDIRKELMSKLSELNITIVELKKTKTTLEDVFVNLVDEEGDK
ncbi:MAG: ABC transporter ATP-binding protein [Clostridia bacterium]|nr:ABC transporter ATP-binding protein [Clostridia bacterium]